MRLETSIKRYIGDSSERKPLPGELQADNTILLATDLPSGSSFFEEDTGFVSRWTGYVWTTAPPERATEELTVLKEILSLLEATREEARTGLGPVVSYFK